MYRTAALRGVNDCCNALVWRRTSKHIFVCKTRVGCKLAPAGRHKVIASQTLHPAKFRRVHAVTTTSCALLTREAHLLRATVAVANGIAG